MCFKSVQQSAFCDDSNAQEAIGFRGLWGCVVVK